MSSVYLGRCPIPSISSCLRAPRLFGTSLDSAGKPSRVTQTQSLCNVLCCVYSVRVRQYPNTRAATPVSIWKNEKHPSHAAHYFSRPNPIGSFIIPLRTMRCLPPQPAYPSPGAQGALNAASLCPNHCCCSTHDSREDDAPRTILEMLSGPPRSAS